MLSSHNYQQGSNEVKYIVSNRIFDYTHVTWLYSNYLVHFIYQYSNIIHSSYKVVSLGIDVLEELMTVFCLLDDKSVIYIPDPMIWCWCAELTALMLNSSMNRLAMRGLMGEPIAASWTCSKYLPWNMKQVFLRQNSSRVIVWGIDIGVLLGSKGSCGSLC